MSVFLFRSNHADLEWLADRLSSYLGISDIIENPGGIPEVVALDPHDELDVFELRQIPHNSYPVSIEFCPLVGEPFRRTGDDEADFDHLLGLLRQAKLNAGSVRLQLE